MSRAVVLSTMTAACICLVAWLRGVEVKACDLIGTRRWLSPSLAQFTHGTAVSLCVLEMFWAIGRLSWTLCVATARRRSHAVGWLSGLIAVGGLIVISRILLRPLAARVAVGPGVWVGHLDWIGCGEVVDI